MPTSTGKDPRWFLRLWSLQRDAVRFGHDLDLSGVNAWLLTRCTLRDFCLGVLLFIGESPKNPPMEKSGARTRLSGSSVSSGDEYSSWSEVSTVAELQVTPRTMPLIEDNRVLDTSVNSACHCPVQYSTVIVINIPRLATLRITLQA